MGKLKEKIKKIDWKFILNIILIIRQMFCQQRYFDILTPKVCVVNIIFPIHSLFYGFKSIKSISFGGFWNTTLGWSIKLYSLTLVIPIVISLMLFVWFILGLDMKYPLIEGIFRAFSDFYITGSLFGISAWRWQILLFLLSLGITITEES